MKKTRWISFLLLLALLASFAVSGTLAAGDGTPEDSMVLNKTAAVNADGTYTITLEAYATGEKIITQEMRDKPVDIVLVLDQSGSMEQKMGKVVFYSYGRDGYNQYYYDRRHNGGEGNLYYPLGDGKYASVSVTREQSVKYTPIIDKNNNYYYDSERRNNLYALVKGSYQKVTVERDGKQGNRRYSYKLEDGTPITDDWQQGSNSKPTFNSNIEGGRLYLLEEDQTQTVYTYTYTDAAGTVHTFTSTGAYAQPPEQLYGSYVDTSVGDKRIDALKEALNIFVSTVNQKAAGADQTPNTPDDVHHRIAVVGYAYGSKGYDRDPEYTNTEVFIGRDQYRYNAEGNSAQDVYNRAFQDMATQDGRNNVTASIGALAANGATYTDLGIEMANGILDKNPVPANEQRSRVVIVFTDGQPGWDGYEPGVAQDAINEAAKVKQKATVYSVGIFEGADATKPGNQEGDDTAKANWFMQKVSSNNGTPQTPSYYLSAADGETLNNIFQQIADNIETGGASTTLNEEAVVKDLIAPSFTLPAGADASNIRLQVYNYNGGDKENAASWEQGTNPEGLHAVVNHKTQQVDVTGFDFAGNYVGAVTENGQITSYRGQKLVISFEVETIAGFLGGNEVPTNTSAGIYEKEGAEKPTFLFPKPKVDVPLAGEFTVQDQSIYLTQSTNLESLLATEIPYDGIQNGYVNITYELYAKDDPTNILATKTIPAGSQEKVDWVWKEGIPSAEKTPAANTEYTIKCTVTPSIKKEVGGVQDRSLPKDATVYVFKPQLTFKDGEVYYGDTAPTDAELAAHLTDTTWINDVNTAPKPTGEAPALELTYAPDETKIKDGMINTREDIPVTVTVKIGGEDVTGSTTFVHTPCKPDEPWTATGGNPAFLLHVKTCQITINKTLKSFNKDMGDNATFLFEVQGDNGLTYYRMVKFGNRDNETGAAIIKELPLGTYTVKELAVAGYQAVGATIQEVTLTKDVPSREVNFTNTATDGPHGDSAGIENAVSFKNGQWVVSAGPGSQT